MKNGVEPVEPVFPVVNTGGSVTIGLDLRSTPLIIHEIKIFKVSQITQIWIPQLALRERDRERGVQDNDE